MHPIIEDDPPGIPMFNLTHDRMSCIGNALVGSQTSRSNCHLLGEGVSPRRDPRPKVSPSSGFQTHYNPTGAVGVCPPNPTTHILISLPNPPCRICPFTLSRALRRDAAQGDRSAGPRGLEGARERTLTLFLLGNAHFSKQ